MKQIKRDDAEGSMGIGSLIIFIAMILIAAVASGVLINTANELQQQAQRTGDEAIQEVSSSFQIKDIVGDTRPFPDHGISNITLKIGLSAGSVPQDLNQTILQVLGDNWETNLEAAETEGEGEADGEKFGWEPLRGDENSEKPIIHSGDLYKITISLYMIEISKGYEGGEVQLGSQDQVEINMIPKHGTPTYTEIVAPSAISDFVVNL